MKRISFKIAKAFKEISYPQLKTKWRYYADGELRRCECIDEIHDTFCDAPYAMEVWLWLWEVKHIHIPIDMYWHARAIVPGKKFYKNSPEEAVIAAIEYLIDNDLIK